MGGYYKHNLFGWMAAMNRSQRRSKGHRGNRLLSSEVRNIRWRRRAEQKLTGRDIKMWEVRGGKGGRRLKKQHIKTKRRPVMECDDYVVVTSECAGGGGRTEPRGGPAHRLFRRQIACDCFACPSFLPAPPNYSQFHLVTQLGPPPKVTVDKRPCRGRWRSWRWIWEGRWYLVACLYITVDSAVSNKKWGLSCPFRSRKNLLVLNYFL